MDANDTNEYEYTFYSRLIRVIRWLNKNINSWWIKEYLTTENHEVTRSLPAKSQNDEKINQSDEKINQMEFSFVFSTMIDFITFTLPTSNLLVQPRYFY